MRFQYDLSVFDSELPDIGEFDVGERYKEDIVRRSIESMASADRQGQSPSEAQTLDSNYLRFVLDDLERVASFTYRTSIQRDVKAESIQVLFRQWPEVKSLTVQRISDIRSPEVLMNLIRSQLTESVRDMMTPDLKFELCECL